jgi:hypothetical protein
MMEERKQYKEKKVRFLPPKKWDPEARWNFFFVNGEDALKKHPLSKCDMFKGLTPKQRLKRAEVWSTRSCASSASVTLRGRSVGPYEKYPTVT